MLLLSYRQRIKVLRRNARDFYVEWTGSPRNKDIHQNENGKLRFAQYLAFTDGTCERVE